MASFRRYGGLNFSANNNITKSYISNTEQMNINNYSGQSNSKEVFVDKQNKTIFINNIDEIIKNTLVAHKKSVININ